MAAVLPSKRQDTFVAVLAFIAFIGLGLSSGLINVAWTFMSSDFDQPLSALGILLLGQTSGYIASSFFSGRIMATLGTGRTFLLGALLLVSSLSAFALLSIWPLIIVAGFLGGFGSGLIDAGLNNYIAAHYGPREMNWLHACFGIGLTIGPALVTALLERDQSWRASYVITAGVMGALALMFLLTLPRWRSITVAATGKAKNAAQPTLGSTLRLPMLWIGVALFLIYAGLEIGAGQWATTILQGHGIDVETAGWWVSAYWGSFTIGRVFFGFISSRFNMVSLLRVCMAGMLLGAGLWWLNITNELGLVGLVLLGFMQAPLFPLFVLGTAGRVGALHAANAIGMQVSAAGVGFAVVPGLAGILHDNVGVQSLGPFFFVTVVLVFVLHEISLLRRAEPVPAAASAD